ncbi:hypothetical protein cypCar_00005558 [Cyprinus carpio]|nr:hypothetical protein cypCar_00005558 [Cyprinus carpio]
MSSEEALGSTLSHWLSFNWLLLPFVMLLVTLVAAFIVVFVLLLYMISPLISPKPLKLNGAHVVHKLVQAKKEVEKCAINDKQVVLCISVDVSKGYNQVESVIKQAQEKLGPVDMLVNCAGMSISGTFEEVGVDSFKMKPYNIYVTVAYPPDTDTPGFAEENKTKPLETRLISETSGVCQPEQVAKVVVKDALQGNFTSAVGPDGYMLSALTCGMSPVTSITEGLQQIVTMGLFRTIALFYLGSFDSIVRHCMIQREQSKAADKRE